MIPVSVLGTPYQVPSSAADTNWAAAQIAFEQALAAGLTAVAGLPDAITNQTITGNTDTIAPTTSIVFLSSASQYTLSTDPFIDAGTTVGQRLLILCNPNMAGSVKVNSDSSVLMISGSFELVANAAIAFMWDGTFWSELYRNSAYALGGQQFGPGVAPTQDPAAAVTIDVANTASYTGGTNTLDIDLTSADVAMIAVPTLTTGVTVADGTEVTIINRGATYKLTLSDNATVAGSALRLHTTTVDLISGSNIRLRYFAADSLWYEVARTITV